MERSNSNRNRHFQQYVALLCALLLAAPESFALPWSQQETPQAAAPPAGELDSLAAPIALYPDPLLSQVLVASTYPLEIVEAGRWLKQNSNLKGKELTDAASKQPWDASVQALVVFPQVLRQLDANIGWTTGLGNAFLIDESGVMDAVQRMRKEAVDNGKLQSTAQQTVTTASENSTSYIEIQPANPEVIYVPQYSPVAIWGQPAYYPYPSLAYPAGPAIAAGAISFGLGVALGSWWAGGWGWNAGWGRHAVIVNNNFIRHNNLSRVNAGRNDVWQHNPEHRAGVPYGSREVANRFAGARPAVGQVEQRLEQGERMAPPSASRAMPPSENRIGNREMGAENFGGRHNAFSDLRMGGERAQMNMARGFHSAGGFHGFGGRRR